MSLQEFHRKLQVTAREKGIPIFGGFELTSRCNLSCKMCYVQHKGADPGAGGDELSAKQWIELGRAAADQGALVVFLTGGEPLIRQDFKEIYGSFCRLGLRITLFTNGTLITDEFARWLSQIPPGTVDVTLYGAQEETYQNLCGQKGAFQRALNGIELLLKYKINTRIKTIIVKRNVRDYAGIKAIAQSYGLNFSVGSLIHGNRSAGIKAIAKERLSPAEMACFDFADPDQFDCAPVDIDQLKEQYRDLPPMFCGAGKSGFFINWRGQLVPCPLFEKPYTEPLLWGYGRAWDMLREEIKNIPGPAKCKDCDLRAFCPVCPGRLYLETGRFDELSKYVCQLAQKKEEFVKKISCSRVV